MRVKSNGALDYDLGHDLRGQLQNFKWNRFFFDRIDGKIGRNDQDVGCRILREQSNGHGEGHGQEYR